MPDKVTCKFLLVLVFLSAQLTLNAQEIQPDADSDPDLPQGAWYFPYETLEKARAGDPAASERAISLEGSWKFAVLPSGGADRAASFFATHFDDRSWNVMDLPHGAVTGGVPADETPSAKIVLLRKRVELDESWMEKPVFLALGQSMEATAWVNGQEIGAGETKGERTEFFISPHLQPGENLIALKVKPGASRLSDSGLALSGMRNVLLYARPRLHFDGVSIQTAVETEKAGNSPRNGLVELRIRLTNRMDSVKQRFWGVLREPIYSDFSIKAYLLDKQGNHVFYFKEYGKQKIRGGDQLTFKYQGEVPHVQVWSHERPNLYRLDIQLLDGAGNVLEAVSQQVGFRSMDFHKGALLVNGTQVPLRVFQPAPRPAGSVTRQQMMEDLRQIKLGNFNAVYGSSYFASPAWYRLSNSHGIYVLDRKGRANPNHPSVVRLPADEPVLKAERPVAELQLVDFLRGTVRVQNHFAFRDLSSYYLEWQLLRNGETVEEGRVQDLNVPPGEETGLSLGYKTRFYEGNDYFLNLRLKTKAADSLVPADHPVASRQFRLGPYEYKEDYQIDKGLIDLTDGPASIALNGYDFRIVFDKETGQIIRYSYKGKELMNKGPELSFRQPLAPDDSLNESYRVWNEAADDAHLVDYQITEDVNGNYYVSFAKVLLNGDARMFQKFRIDGRGAMLVENVFVKMQGTYPDMPGFGTRFTLPGEYARMEWYGREPEALNEVGIYQGPIDEYTGNDKDDVRWVRLTRKDGYGLLIRKEQGLLHLAARRDLPGGAGTQSAQGRQDRPPGQAGSGSPGLSNQRTGNSPDSDLLLHVDLSRTPVPFRSMNFTYRIIPYIAPANF